MDIGIRIMLAGLLLVGAGTLCLSTEADRYRNIPRRNLMLFSALFASAAAGLILVFTGDL